MVTWFYLGEIPIYLHMEMEWERGTVHVLEVEGF